MLHCCLERVCAAELRVYDYETDRPVNGHGEDDEEDYACDEARLLECVWLTNDASATVESPKLEIILTISFSSAKNQRKKRCLNLRGEKEKPIPPKKDRRLRRKCAEGQERKREREG